MKLPVKTTQESRVFLALGLGFCLLVLACTTAFLAARSLIASSEHLNNIHEVRLQLSLLLATHVDIQTGERGYVITGNPDYLQPYELARARADEVYLDLSLLTRDIPALSSSLTTIDELRTRQIRVAELIIQARQQEGLASAQQLVDAGEDRRLMLALRNAITEIDTNIANLLASGYEAERQAVARLDFTLLASTLFALLVAAGGGTLIRQDFKLRRIQEHTIAEQNRELEARVKERTAELQGSNADLLRFNNSMVDRELRMIELKEEINALCQSHGLTARYDMAPFREET